MPYDPARYKELARERGLSGPAPHKLNAGLVSTLRALIHEGHVEPTAEAVRRRLGLSDTPQGRAHAERYLAASSPRPSGGGARAGARDTQDPSL